MNEEDMSDTTREALELLPGSTFAHGPCLLRGA